jgi:uncharacterized membrane protein
MREAPIVPAEPPNEGKKPSNEPERAVAGNPRDARQVTQVGMELHAWQGPIPPPEVLRAYNEIIENGAERIFSQFEKETHHRHRMQRRTQTFPFYDQIAGRGSALVFALACLLLSGYAIAQGAQVPATVLGGAMIIAGINAFRRRS